ncbi:putative chaperone DnaJ [Rosa chinensis]|uniref:Putative chaperone DnaJ n=1 Tax=Rosa chinensis TaxID=74649 RepID=A0A2P6R030_ROSCH|nr:putative chaperone DnaJ [Rosa chinensis]
MYYCYECKGTGQTIRAEDRCQQCKGDKVVLEKKILEVHVDIGIKNGQKIIFPGEAHKGPNTITGNIVIVVQQKEHPKFKLTHLDGRQLLIKSEPGEVVNPNQCKAIHDEGMPIYSNPFIKGKLYVQFTVTYPNSLSPELCKALEAVLPCGSD